MLSRSVRVFHAIIEAKSAHPFTMPSNHVTLKFTPRIKPENYELCKLWRVYRGHRGVLELALRIEDTIRRFHHHDLDCYHPLTPPATAITTITGLTTTAIITIATLTTS